MVVDHVVVPDGSMKLRIGACLQKNADVGDVEQIALSLDYVHGPLCPQYRLVETGLQQTLSERGQQVLQSAIGGKYQPLQLVRTWLVPAATEILEVVL